ncbi:MAG TPA: hypothetical protein VD905_13945 [Flavobacteriales bacterium]|nr:hypothetical protein [Flavobacteriales bacterium]
MQKYIVYLVFYGMFAACGTKNDRALEVIRENCNCKKVEMAYSKNNDGSGRYTYTVYESKALDTGYTWYGKEADRLLALIQTEVKDFCTMNEKITIQFCNNWKYRFSTFWKCTPQFEF